MPAPARQYHHELIHYIRRDFTFADRGKSLEIGTIPAGSVIVKPISGVNVHTAFNGSGTDLIDIGTAGTADLYATDLAGQTVGFQALDEAVTQYVAVDTTLYVAYADANSDAVAGAAQAIIAYIPNMP